MLIADAQKVKGLAPLACMTDHIDARVLAELSWGTWSRRSGGPTPRLAASVSSRASGCTGSTIARPLKDRIHATLITFRRPCPSDLFGYTGRELLDRLAIPDPWRRNVDASLQLIDDLELQTASLTVELKRRDPPLHPAAGHRSSSTPRARDRAGSARHAARRRHRPTVRRYRAQPTASSGLDESG